MDTPSSITHIGKYEILAELGRGGMGVVYRAEDKNIGREVAIKTLTDATPELRQRFLVEARSGVLNHQNIVTVFDFGEQQGNPYIVMEYLRGESLEKILRGAKPLDLIEKLDIARQVCEGLGHAHSKGVVHRDIKPANIMVMPGGQVKIVDFGIARLANASGHTQTGAVIGTFHYISPERLKGDPSDGRADIWAVGIMLYQMLTGTMPFAGEDISALHKVVNETFPPISIHLADYPGPLDQVLDRALAKDPNDRYATAEEMAADLQEITDKLKRNRVGEMLDRVRVLLDQDQLTAARSTLLELQRLDPQNVDVRRLLRDVQDRLLSQKRFEEVRQRLNLAEEAVLAQRFTEALDLYKQATRIDPTARGITEKIEYVRALKEKVDRVAALQQQARDARLRNDFTAASSLIDQALTLDERNTSLRNEKAQLFQEQERAAREHEQRRLKDLGREKLFSRAYTDAIGTLREALQLDPSDPEAQRLFEEATARQEEERRRKVIEQIVAEIQDCLYRGELQRGLNLTQRALDRLPAEAVLLRLKSDTEKRLKEEQARTLLQETSKTVQQLFFTEPAKALQVVEEALLQMPGEERLLALHDRVMEHVKKEGQEAERARLLKEAREAIDTAQFDKAIVTLERATVECGESPEIAYLMEHAQGEKLNRARAQAAAVALERAQRKIAEDDLEGAVALLRPAAQQTRNASVDQLLRQTQERLDEVTRRMEAVVARVRSLSETDPAQALQLLQSQPPAVQLHSQLKALRTKIDNRLEQLRVIEDAVEQSIAMRKKRDLRGGLDILESVRRAYGESPELTAAIADYIQRRGPIATEMVVESIAAAQSAIVGKNGKQALEELAKSANVREFADSKQQAEWERLAQEAAKAAPGGASPTETFVIQKKGMSSTVVGSIAAALLAIVAGAVFFVRHGSHGGAPAAKVTFVQLNAAPFAEVVSVTAANGNAIPLPDGDHLTPMRLDNVPEGVYTVTFKSPDGTSKQESCDLAANTLCAMTSPDLTDAQIDEILAGKK